MSPQAKPKNASIPGSPLPAHVRAELLAIWHSKPLIPTIASRSQWSALRGVHRSRVATWFTAKKSRAKKAGRPIGEETYDLSLDPPPKQKEEEDPMPEIRKKREMVSRSPPPPSKRVKLEHTESDNCLASGSTVAFATSSDDTLVPSSSPDPIKSINRAYSHFSELATSPPLETLRNQTSSPSLPASDAPSPLSVVKHASLSPLHSNIEPMQNTNTNGPGTQHTQTQDQELLESSHHTCPCALCCPHTPADTITCNLDNINAIALATANNIHSRRINFDSVAFQYHLPDFYHTAELMHDINLDVDFDLEEQLLRDAQLNWVEKWKEDNVFMLVDDDVAADVKEELCADGDEVDEEEEDEEESGWMINTIERVSISLSL